VQITVDFNPVADKMRIIGADGTNLRADVDSGKVTEDQSLKFAANDPAAGRTPTIVAGAYGNSVKGAKETTLYDIDALGGFFRQAPPNDGILNTVGTLGVSVDRVGFDIVTDATGTNRGVLVTNGKLFMLDLTTGQASGGRTIVGLPADVRDIAVLPSPMAKQAANMGIDADATGMRADTGMAASYRPKPTSGDMAGTVAKPMPMKSSYAQAKMARMKAPQCPDRRPQY